MLDILTINMLRKHCKLLDFSVKCNLLTIAHSGLTYGQITDQAPSRFLKEIPHELVHIIDLEETSLHAMQAHIHRWMQR